MSYGAKLRYLQFNPGVAIKVGGDTRTLAQRIMAEVDVALLLRAALLPRDRALLATTYGGGLRISEVVTLLWRDVIGRDDGKVQLSVLGKGEKRREVLLPAAVGKLLLALRGDAGDDDPVFRCSHTTVRADGRHPNALSTSAVAKMIKRTVRRAGINLRVSMHWLRHAHASHSLDRGAVLSTVCATLGHASVATTGQYLHARPGSSSAFSLDEGIFQ